MTIPDLLLSCRLVRLDTDLLLMLQELAAAAGKSIPDYISDVLYDYAFDARVQTKNDRRWQSLTPREQQVAALTCMGYTNKEIAERLVLSVNTVRSHMRNVLDKYDVSSKADLRLRLAGWDFRGWLEQQAENATADTF